MAVPAYTTDLNDIFTNGGASSWFLIGGGRETDPETDDFIMGTSCWSHDPFSSNIEGGLYPSSETVASGDVVYVWTKCDVAATIDTHAAGGISVCIGSGTGDYWVYYVLGKDDYAYGGWKCIPVDPSLHGSASTSVGSPTTTTSWGHFGVRWDVPSSGASKGFPMKIDAMRHGRYIEVTAGDASDPATWAGVAAHDGATARMWGICQPTDAGAELQGIIYWGTGSTAVHFDDSSGSAITLIDTEWTASDFTKIIIDHASTVFNMTGVTIKALGTNNPGQFIFNNASTVSALESCTFDSIGITTLRDAVVATNCLWKKSGQITQNGATITDTTISESTGSSALLVDTALEMADITGTSFVDNNSGGTPVLDATPYLDGSDVVATDGGTDWSGVTNSDDGSTGTQATATASSSSTITIEGTDYSPATDDGNPTQVRVRIYGYADPGAVGTSTLSAAIYENGGSTLLGTAEITDVPSASAGWSSYITLSEHSGGWTTAKIQALEVQISGTHSAGNGYGISVVQLEVTESAGHSIELTATGTHTFTDITFSGGGGTPGSNPTASSGSAYADVYNNSGGSITLNVVGGDLPSVRNAASSDTTVTQSVFVTVTTKDKDGNLMSDVAVGVYKSSDDTELFKELTVAGVATESISYPGSAFDVYIRARKSTSGTRYYNNSTIGEVTADGLAVTLVLQEDSVA